jgi:hypothetical protein
VKSGAVVRLLTCAAFALATSFLVVVIRFVALQPITALRNFLYLGLPIVSPKWSVVPFAVAFVVSWYATRSPRQHQLPLALGTLAVATTLWWAMAYDPLQSWLLPPVTTK